MKWLIVFMCIQGCYGVIYHLNDSEHERMPKLIELAPYEECLRGPAALYCTAHFTLYSDTASPLMDMIQEYSEHSTKHFNYTVVLRGECVSACDVDDACDAGGACGAGGSVRRLQACVARTTWRRHRLRARPRGRVACGAGRAAGGEGGALELAAAAGAAALLLLNAAGTAYDVLLTDGETDGIRFLTCFSVRRNFRKLLRDPLKESDPRLQRLRGLNGLRTIGVALVILGHSMATSIFVDNTHYIEELYGTLWIQLLVNGSLMMQIFFIITGFLMIYNCCLYAEKHDDDWKMIFKAILIRWLRLTPAYAVVLAFTVTWMRYLGSGPLWNMMIEVEVEDCTRYWWWHLLYINNYIDSSNCMIQSWYLAATMQQFCVGIMIFVFCRSKASRILVLSVLFIIGVITPALHTYYQDLDATLMIRPETARNHFITDETFNQVYIRTHTNLVGYVMGLALGYIYYYWKDVGIDLEQYKKYRLLYWCTLPLLLATIFSGSIFYADRPRMPLLFRTFYAALVKPVFCCLLSVLIMGVILKFENFYRGVLEWNGWTVPNKVGYGAYLLHVSLLRYYIGVKTSIGKTSILYQVNSYAGLLVIAFAAAYPFWLLVEAPLAQLFNIIFGKNEKSRTNSTEEKIETKSEKIHVRL